MSAATPSTALPAHLPALTGLRAVAAMLVLALHTTQNVPVPWGWMQPVVDVGYLGVDLFFVLSGFIIAHVYGSAMRSPTPRTLAIYLWHRLIRLYPVHAVVLAALVGAVWLAQALGIVLNEARSWPTIDIIWNLLLLHAWGVTPRPSWNVPSWSISAEWFAYLLFPMLMLLAFRIRSALVALLIAASALVAAALLFEIMGASFNAWTGAPALVRVTAEFSCGVMLRRALALQENTAASRDVADATGWVALLGLLAGAMLALPEFALVALLALFVPAAALANGSLRAALTNRPITWLGEISYSVYMVHFPILVVLRRVWETSGWAAGGAMVQWLMFVASIAIILAAAALLFVLVERPARQGLRNTFGVIDPPATAAAR